MLWANSNGGPADRETTATRGMYIFKVDGSFAAVLSHEVVTGGSFAPAEA
jgi:hypothetical protein